MKVEFLFVGKLSAKYLQEGIDVYLKRLNYYLPSTVIVLPSSSVKGNKKVAIKEEGVSLLKKISPNDFVVLLDETGKEFSSTQLSVLMNKSMVNAVSKMVFVTGGPYGINEDITARANLVLSFSKFTFTHEMIRLFLLEQVYRAMTILNNEPYHH